MLRRAMGRRRDTADAIEALPTEALSIWASVARASFAAALIAALPICGAAGAYDHPRDYQAQHAVLPPGKPILC
ncbi:protein of unknown function [Methylocella tundrae]|uniref:Uncharacterized protein n=1 Tax=Methylocella tundrae TaxID=227605 RepID=A0A4U8Z007_METTU|nr:protein of unknown function [Methylocella tundrae]